MALLQSCVHCRAENADLKILIADSSLLSSRVINDHLCNPDTTPSDLAQLFLHPHNPAENVFNNHDTIVVLNKADLLSEGIVKQWQASISGESRIKMCWLSCKTEEGVEGFLQQLKSILEKM